MSDAPDDNNIPVLWFDRNGCGPDELRIQLHPFPPDMGGEIPAHLGLRISAGGLVIGAKDMLGGGFYMDHASVSDLHRQLGEWLDANTPTPSPPDKPPQQVLEVRVVESAGVAPSSHDPDQVIRR